MRQNKSRPRKCPNKTPTEHTFRVGEHAGLTQAYYFYSIHLPGQLETIVYQALT